MLGGFANYYSYIEKEKEETRIIKCDLIENTCIQINIKENEKYLIDYVSYSKHD